MAVGEDVKLAVLEARLRDHEASLYNAQVEANLCAIRGMDEQAQVWTGDCAGFVKTIEWLEGEIKALQSE